MYELTKAAAFLATPLSICLELAVITALLARAGRAAWAWRSGVGAVAVLWMASSPVVGAWLEHVLEGPFQKRPASAFVVADVAVLLGGAVIPARPPEHPHVRLTRAASRVDFAAQLYEAGRVRTIVVAAGQPGGAAAGPTEAAAIVTMLRDRGIPQRDIRIEEESRNTRENARNTLPIVIRSGARRVLLVSSAIHMRRALATFQAEWRLSGIEVIPAASDQTEEFVNFFSASSYIPDPATLLYVTRASRELAGMLALAIISPSVL